MTNVIEARFSLCRAMPNELNGLKKRVVNGFDLPADMRNYIGIQIPKSGNSLQDFIPRYIIDIMENLT